MLELGGEMLLGFVSLIVGIISGWLLRGELSKHK